MVEKKIQAVVLAAGRSSRFNTNTSKLAEKICGQEMILYTTSLLEKLHIPTTIVVGYARDVIQKIITNKHGSFINFAVQENQQGTGHALLSSAPYWNAENILVINGDMPLVTEDIIEELLRKHTESQAVISFITAHNSDPSITGYGRVIQEENTIKIIEAKEFNGDAHEHCCINAGIYLINVNFLKRTLQTLEPNSITHEFYLTDLVKIASDDGLIVNTIKAPFDTIRGVNDFKELWAVEQIKRCQLISKLMEHGVRFYAAQTVHVDMNISIGSGSYIGTGVHIINGTRVGQGCHIEAFSILDNAIIGDNVRIHTHTVVTNSTIQSDCKIGPFAHIEENSHVAHQSSLGNFVQVKRSNIGTNCKAKHLAFIGDTTMGNRVNIGAGTITCNYNGISKHNTVIKDDCFIGSNNTLVAPVTLESESYTAAGSVITHNVPEKSLAIARSRQINKEGYAQKLKKKSESPYLAAIKTTDTLVEHD